MNKELFAGLNASVVPPKPNCASGVWNSFRFGPGFTVAGTRNAPSNTRSPGCTSGAIVGSGGGGGAGGGGGGGGRRRATTNGLSDETLAHKTPAATSAGGVSIVRSTYAPSSPCRMRSVANAAASVARLDASRQTEIAPAYDAVVATSTAIAPSNE